jgi:glycine oxidase
LNRNKQHRAASKRPPEADVVIVGGGIMGCASAWQLARAGLRVTVLERSVPGAEASSAAAGILGTNSEAHAPGPMSELAQKSGALYAAFAADLTRATGIDVEYRTSGVLRVTFDADAAGALEEGPGSKLLARKQLLELEPELSTKLAGGVRYPGDGRIDPRRLLRALHIAAQHAGVVFRSGAYVRRVLCDDDRVRGVALEDGSELEARWVVIAAGSWTTLVEGVGLAAGRVQPARGQIVEVVANRPLLSSVVFGPRAYLVPRDDGRVLIGSTLEFVGYQRDVTAGAVRDLLTAAIELVPALESASLGAAWSNFRPYTADELPLLGPTKIAGLLLATGHYRNGILLAPITAQIVTSVVLGKRPPVALEPFSAERTP